MICWGRADINDKCTSSELNEFWLNDGKNIGVDPKDYWFMMMVYKTFKVKGVKTVIGQWAQNLDGSWKVWQIYFRKNFFNNILIMKELKVLQQYNLKYINFDSYHNRPELTQLWRWKVYAPTQVVQIINHQKLCININGKREINMLSTCISNTESLIFDVQLKFIPMAMWVNKIVRALPHSR